MGFLLVLVYYLVFLSFLVDPLSFPISVERLGGGEATLVCVLSLCDCCSVGLLAEARFSL